MTAENVVKNVTIYMKFQCYPIPHFQVTKTLMKNFKKPNFVNLNQKCFNLFYKKTSECTFKVYFKKPNPRIVTEMPDGKVNNYISTIIGRKK